MPNVSNVLDSHVNKLLARLLTKPKVYRLRTGRCKLNVKKTIAHDEVT